jgi:O-antigen ligase
LGFLMLMPFTTHLPKSIQRTLSFLPIEVDSRVRMDAQSSLDWRFEMWRAVVPDLPKYIWLGKGFAQSPTEIYLTQEAVRRGRVPGYQGAILSGDFHSGPLSIYVPFGSIGVLTFLIFVFASIRGLYLNMSHGDEELRIINRFLFAYFTGHVIFFIFAFGAFSYQMCSFTGTIGLSVALNGGICRRPVSALRPVRFRGNLALRPSQPSET